MPSPAADPIPSPRCAVVAPLTDRVTTTTTTTVPWPPVRSSGHETAFPHGATDFLLRVLFWFHFPPGPAPNPIQSLIALGPLARYRTGPREPMVPDLYPPAPALKGPSLAGMGLLACLRCVARRANGRASETSAAATQPEQNRRGLAPVCLVCLSGVVWCVVVQHAARCEIESGHVRDGKDRRRPYATPASCSFRSFGSSIATCGSTPAAPPAAAYHAPRRRAQHHIAAARARVLEWPGAKNATAARIPRHPHRGREGTFCNFAARGRPARTAARADPSQPASQKRPK